ncbi:hypothetical protein ACFL03_14105 [Thermodesulfobacteriota bacterium]
MKKIFLITAVVLFVFSLFTANAIAELKWHTATVDKAGSGGKNYYMMITDAQSETPTWGPMWFIFVSDDVKANLATALTAASSGAKVWAYVDPTLGHWSACLGLVICDDDCPQPE